MSELGEWDTDEHDVDQPAQDTAAGADAASVVAPEPAELFYANVGEFVTEFLAPRETHAAPAWRPQGWQHAERVYRPSDGHVDG